MAARKNAAMAAVFSFLVATFVVAPASVALADEPPAVDNPTSAVTADALPTAQINGVAWDQVVVGNTVYVAGQFTSARPAGSAAGTNETPRANLMSYNLTTGVMTSWAPQVNGRIRVITASPDGNRIYIGGSFTTVNGVARSRIAAFNTSDGSLVTSFAPAVNSDVFGITASGSTVYLGGWFTVVSNVARARLAAVTAASGALLAWAPTTDSTVYGLGLTTAQDRVVIVGNFSTVNGASQKSVASLDAVTGASYAFAAGQLLSDIGTTASMLSLKVVNDQVFSTGYTYGVGNFEGTVVMDAYTGVIQNMLDCHGDTYDSVPMNGLVYSVSHHHTCDNVGAYPEVNPRRWQRTDAFTLDVRGTVATNNQAGSGYGNWAGQPVGSVVNWFPDFGVGTYTGAGQAAWSVETSGSYLVEGGEFLTVNGKAQQGLVRFATRAVVSNPKVGPANTAAELAPTLYQRTSTSVGGSFQAGWDRDGMQLTYKVIRSDLGPSSPVATVPGSSTFWSRPVFDFIDTTVLPGTAYTYYVVAADSDGNSVQGQSASVTPVTTDMGVGYPAQVLADAPSHYWRLGQAPSDYVGPDQVSTRSLSLSSGAVGGASGALTGSLNTATTFAGTSLGRAATSVSEPAPQAFSLEFWFRSTSTAGGKLVGFGNTPTGNSTSYDRQVYLDNSGRLTFGVYAGAARTITTPGTYTNGAWHHVVASMSSLGLKLYVDGNVRASSTATTSAQAYTGYWRLGGDTMGSWPNRGSSENVAGTLDEVAVYPAELSSAQVAAHYTAGTTSPQANQPPLASFTATTQDLSVTVDASASSDADGSIVAYSWDFGDGGTGSGSTAVHAYATGGTYAVRLSVVDNAGTAASTTSSVTVGTSAGTVVAKDAFARVQSRWGTADAGGAWTDSGASYYSTDGRRGVVTITSAGSGPSARLNSVSAANISILSDVALNAVPTGGTYLHQLLARASGTTSYKLVVRIDTTGGIRYYLARVVSGTETVLVSATNAAFGYTAGERLKLRLTISGASPTTLTGSVWRASGTEPTSPQLSTTDSTATLQSAGAVGITSFASSTTTSLPLVATIDDFIATVPQP